MHGMKLSLITCASFPRRMKFLVTAVSSLLAQPPCDGAIPTAGQLVVFKIVRFPATCNAPLAVIAASESCAAVVDDDTSDPSDSAVSSDCQL